MNQPAYIHDCPRCRFLGRGRAAILDGKKIFDFYVCEGSGNYRSFIARYGSGAAQYVSGPLLGTAELSHLDLVALYNGLELLPEENERLLLKLADMYRRRFSVQDYLKFSAGDEVSFGSGNYLFSNS